VGCGIKVWWPLDRRFYKGEVISYDAKKKRHKVLYDDGEQEILDLGVERWQLTTKKQRLVKNPQDTSSTPAWAPVPL
jgi:sister-chromatid-cohesion protein PDS5